MLNLPFKEEDLWSKIARHLKVEYIYEAQTKSISSNEHLEYDLSIMPPEWLERVNSCATAANAKEIYSLLEQIPEQHSELVQAIAHLVDDFCFEQIIELTSVN